MFEEKLLYFYKSGLSYWHLAIKYFWKTLVIYGVINLLIIYFLDHFDNEIILIIISLISAIASTIVFLIPIWKFTEKKYEAVYPDPEWFILICASLKRFLQNETNGKLSVEALDFLISRLTKRLENKSKSSFLGIFSNSITLIISFLIPVWSAFNTWRFKDVNEFADFSQYIILILISAFIIFPFLKWVIAHYVRIFFDDISEVARLSSLLEKLEIIRFTLKTDSYFNEIDQYLKEKKNVIDEVIKEFEVRYENYARDPYIRIYKNIKAKIYKVKTNKKAFKSKE